MKRATSIVLMLAATACMGIFGIAQQSSQAANKHWRPRVATPVFSPGGGAYTAPQWVTISDATPGAVIYYTLDGSTPTAASAAYSQPVAISTSTTLKALAIVSGTPSSAIATATYSVPDPTTQSVVSSAGSVPNYGNGFTASGLTLNGSAAISNTRLRLTDGGISEARSAFFSIPVNVQAFTNDFSFQLASANADGFTFAIQGQSATALGAEGGCLGYCGITPSLAVKFDLYDNAGEGSDSTGLFINGAFPATPATDMSSAGVDLHSGDVMNVHMTYDGATLAWSVTDSSTGAQFQTSSAVNIPSVIGANAAYVGFTAGTGGSSAIQDILIWTYSSGSGPQLARPQLIQQTAIPSFSPAGGTFTTAQSVTISDATAAAVIYYTTDGSTPTVSSTRYNGAMLVGQTTTLKAMATASGMTNSAVATATEIIQAGTTSQPPQITTSGIPSGAVDVPYGTTLMATSGVPPYSWNMAGGQLAPGLTLGSTGQIAGTPSQAGTFSFTVQVKDSANQITSATFSANIAPASSPVISSISPASGPTVGGTAVTLTGSNFLPGASVTFGGTAASSVTVSGPSQIRALTPSHIAGSVAVIVQQNGQSNSSAINFTYNSLTPTVNSVSPNSGPTAGGTSVTISGTNFLAGALVLFGTVPATNVTVLSATQIQAITPANPSGQVTITVENSGNLSGVLSGGFSYTAANSAPPINVSGLINWNSTYQQIDGFGAAHAYGPDLTPAQADLIFSTTSGIGMTLMREVIPSDGSVDGITSMQLAQARGAQVWLVPFSPPASYKSNGSVRNGGTLLSADFSAYANYLKNYITNLANNGISIYGLSVQNEPDITQTYESCTFTDQALHDFITTALGPTFAGSGVKLMLPEPSGLDLLSSYDDTTMNDPAAAAYVSILAAHDYDGAADQQNNYGKKLWETEVSDLDPLDSSIASGLAYATQIHNLLTVTNVNAWHFWEIEYIAGSQSDNECLICNGTPTKRLYTIGNFSKFVRPGYLRIDVPANPVNGVFVSAYKDPLSGNFAIVVINTNGSATPLSLGLNGFSAPSLTPWVTSASLNLAQQTAIPAGTAFSTTLPANSVTTFTGTAQ